MGAFCFIRCVRSTRSPILKSQGTDAAFIEAIRREHELPYRDVVTAHFTMVSGCGDVPESDYLTHVKSPANFGMLVGHGCEVARSGGGLCIRSLP